MKKMKKDGEENCIFKKMSYLCTRKMGKSYTASSL